MAYPLDKLNFSVSNLDQPTALHQRPAFFLQPSFVPHLICQNDETSDAYFGQPFNLILFKNK